VDPAALISVKFGIAAPPAAADRANADWQRDLSVSHERIGDLAHAARDRGRWPHRITGRV
jgi:hypothetical protein